MAKPHPKAPSVTLHNGRTINWGMVESAYREQAEGKSYTVTRMRRDLRKKRGAFDTLTRAVGMMDSGRSYYATAKTLNRSRDVVKDWVDGKRMPREISLELHDFRQTRQRKQLKIDRTKKYEIGYFIGVSAADRLQRRTDPKRGSVKFAVSTNDKNIADTVAASVKGVFGVDTHRPKTHTAPRAANPTQEVIIESANLSKLFKRTIGRGKTAMDYLPDRREARLGFTRAVLDLGKTWVAGRPGRKSVFFWHGNPEVRNIVSQTLSEQGVGNENVTRQGQPSVKIAPEHIPRFRESVGFRSAEKDRRLSR